MPPVTPNAPHLNTLSELASRYVDPDSLPWTPSRFPGVDLKVLMQDDTTGISTCLTRFAPGAELPEHEHVGLEQSWVLEGSLVDSEGQACTGQYVWRPGGSIHRAHSPDGAIVLSFFMKPNRFLSDPD